MKDKYFEQIQNSLMYLALPVFNGYNLKEGLTDLFSLGDSNYGFAIAAGTSLLINHAIVMVTKDNQSSKLEKELEIDPLDHLITEK